MERLFTHYPVGVRHAQKPLRGYTLVEMLVVLAIIIIIAAIALAGQSNFSRTLSLNNAAFDVALSIRQAQSYGLSNRTASGISNAGYGVHFTRGVTGSYLLFADTSPAASGGKPDSKPGDKLYAAQDSVVGTYGLNNGFALGTFCADPGLTSQKCSNTSGTPLQTLDIVFTRPESDAYIFGGLSGGSHVQYQTACISVASPAGDTRVVRVSQTGQVYTTQSCP